MIHFHHLFVFRSVCRLYGRWSYSSSVEGRLSESDSSTSTCLFRDRLLVEISGMHFAHFQLSKIEVGIDLCNEKFSEDWRYSMIWPDLLIFVLMCECATFSLAFHSCYVVALTQNRQYGQMAPLGGLLFMAGWLSLF